jgi:predicted nucleic acid-binding protein
MAIPVHFFDTSVFVAAFLVSHPFHRECSERISSISKDNAVCSSHTFAELYVTLTRQPRPQKVSPATAAAMVERLASRIKPISLSPTEFVDVIRSMGSQGLSGAILYDALLLGCARKSQARKIYTLNVSHFRLVADDLAPRVSAP